MNPILTKSSFIIALFVSVPAFAEPFFAPSKDAKACAIQVKPLGTQTMIEMHCDGKIVPTKDEIATFIRVQNLDDKPDPTFNGISTYITAQMMNRGFTHPTCTVESSGVLPNFSCLFTNPSTVKSN